MHSVDNKHIRDGFIKSFARSVLRGEQIFCKISQVRNLSPPSFTNLLGKEVIILVFIEDPSSLELVNQVAKGAVYSLQGTYCS